MSLLVDPPPYFAQSSREFVAMYEVEDQAEYLAVFPFGYFADFKYMRVPLERTEPPYCAIHLAGRCLLGMNPLDRELTGLTGRVVLDARITRGGKMTRLRVDKPRNGESDQQERLSRTVLANVKTWWLEAASEEQDVRITYSVGNVTDSTMPGHPELMLNAPGGVTILAEVLNGR